MEGNLKDLRLKYAYIDLCQLYNPNWMITLVTNQDWSPIKMTALIGEFARRLDFVALGRKCFKKPISQRADGIFFIEKSHINVHAHGILHVPYDIIGAESIWTKLCPSGSINIQKIYSNGGAAYSAKVFEQYQNSEDPVVLLTDFMSVTSRNSSNT